MSEHSHLRTKRCARWLCRYFTPEKDIGSITAEDLVSYAAVAKATRAAVTVDAECRTYALACRACGIEPAALPGLGDMTPKPQDPFTHDEVRRFMVACSPEPRFRLLAYVLHWLGVRNSETRKLEEPEWQNQRVRCNGTKTKNSKRWIPIPDEMFEYMLELRARGEWTGWPRFSNVNVDHFVERTSRRAGMGRRSPNDCRGGLATRLAGEGVPAAIRGALMGNSERMQEQTYSQPQKLEGLLAEAMNKQQRVKPHAPPVHRQKQVSTANVAPPTPITLPKSLMNDDD